MEWLEQMAGQVVGLDTAPLIYFIEENSRYLVPLRSFFEAVEAGHVNVVTSMVTLVEVLVQPLKEGKIDLASEYRNILLSSRHLRTIPLSSDIAEKAANLRARYGLRTPDAVQIATAQVSGATWILTNDTRWPVLPDMRICVLDSLIRSGNIP